MDPLIGALSKRDIQKIYILGQRTIMCYDCPPRDPSDSEYFCTTTKPCTGSCVTITDRKLF